MIQWLSDSFLTFNIELRRPDGLSRSQSFPLRRSLNIGGFYEAWSASSASKTSVADYSDSGISVKPFSNAMQLSFPSTLDVNADGQNIFKSTPTAEARRVTISQPGRAHELKFSFPNGAVLSVELDRPTKRDAVTAINELLPVGWVALAHLIALVLMTLSFSMPHTFRRDVVDVSQIDARVVSFQTGQPIGYAPTTQALDASAKQQMAMKRALKSFNLQSTKPSLTGKRFEGFADSAQATDPSMKLAPRIGFAGPGGMDAPPLNVSEQEIARLLGGVNQQLKECYDDALIQDSSLQGRPQVVISIAKAGNVEDVGLNYVKGSSKSLSVLTNCFRSTIRKLKFPEANQAFAVTKTIVLTR